MALPLLALQAAGVLAGGQYLLKKNDERQANSMLDEFNPQFSGLQAAQLNAGWEAQANDIRDADYGFLPRKAERVESFLQEYQDALANHTNNQAALQQQYQAANRSAIDDVRGIEQKAAERFANVQNSMAAADKLLGGESFSHQDLYGLVYQMAEALAPGEMKTADDINNIINTNPVFSRIVNSASKELGGSADPTLGDQLYDTMYQLYKAESDRYGQVQQDFDRAVKAYQNQGYLPFEDRGIYDLSYGVRQGYEAPSLQDLLIRRGAYQVVD